MTSAMVGFGLALSLALAGGAEAGLKGIVKIGNDVVVEEGEDAREAVAVGGSVTVNGRVRQDAVAVGGNLTLGPGARVGGNAVSVGGRILADEGSLIEGDEVEVSVPGLAAALGTLAGWNWIAIMAGARLVSLVGMIAVALLLVAVFPRPFDAVSGVVRRDMGNAALWGLAGLVLIVPVAVALVLSLVGIVLVPFELLLVVCMFVVGYIAVARYTGARIAESINRGDMRPVLQTLVGLLVLSAVSFVPVVGWVVRVAACLIGFGAVVVAVKDSWRVKRVAAPASSS